MRKREEMLGNLENLREGEETPRETLERHIAAHFDLPAEEEKYRQELAGFVAILEDRVCETCRRWSAIVPVGDPVDPPGMGICERLDQGKLGHYSCGDWEGRPE